MLKRRPANTRLIRTIEADFRPLNCGLHTAFWRTALDSLQKWRETLQRSDEYANEGEEVFTVEHYNMMSCADESDTVQSSWSYISPLGCPRWSVCSANHNISTFEPRSFSVSRNVS